MAGLWAAAFHAGGTVAQAVSDIRDYNVAARVSPYLDSAVTRFGIPVGRAFAGELAADRVSRFVSNQGMQGGMFFNWPGSSAMWRRVGRRAGAYARSVVDPRPSRTRAAYVPRQRAPFVRYPRMYARPIPAWQSRFGGVHRRGAGRVIHRGRFYEPRDAWKSSFQGVY